VSLAPAVAELERGDDRRDRELALTCERLRIDDEPRLALRGEDVLPVQVLVEQHLLALCRRQLAQNPDRNVTVTRVRQLVLDPEGGLVLERVEPVAAPPEPRQQADQNVERVRRLGEERSGLRALEQQRVPLVVALEQPHGAVAVPAFERVRLVLALAVRESELQHRGRAVGAFRTHDVAGGTHSVRLADRELPFPGATVEQSRDAAEPVDQARLGHRYASAWRFASDGSFARMSSRRDRSSSATMTVSSSGACASTMPQGSTISERPYAGLPAIVSDRKSVV